MDWDEEKDTIYDAAMDCSGLFQQWLESLESTSSDHEVAEDLRGRFNLWSAYVGAFASPKASLDARLVVHQDIKDMVLELLNMVKQNLKHELETKRSVIIAQVGSFQRTPEDPPLLLGSNAIEEAVKRLHSLGVAIRRSATRGQRQKQSYGSSKQDEERCYTNFVKYKFPNAKQSLVDQLGSSIYFRGRSMFYQQRHNRKIAKLREKNNQAQLKVKESIKEPGEIAGSTVLATSHPPAQEHQHVPMSETNYSETIHSEIDKEDLLNRMSQPRPSYSHISRGSSVRENQDEIFGYPKKPKAEKGHLSVSCPICSEPLESVGLTEKEWRAHIDRDIEPYICISEECTDPPQFFVHLRDWKDHMQRKHTLDWAHNIHTMTWYCEMDHSDNSVDSNVFGNKGDFIQHLSATHGGTITRPQILAKARRNKTVTIRDPFTCPLCDCCPEEVMPRLTEKPYELLSTHIARHLKSLAFFSLSYIDYEEYSSTSSMVRSRTDGTSGIDNSNATRLNSHYESFDDIPPTIVGDIAVSVDGLQFHKTPELENPVVWPDELRPPSPLTLSDAADGSAEYFDYREIKSTAELPFEIPEPPNYDEKQIIVPVKSTSQSARRQLVMKKLYLEPEPGEGIDERTKTLCRREAMALWHARHQHVIEVVMAFTIQDDERGDGEGPYFGIIMELAEQGNISKHLACLRPADEMKKITQWFECLANATAYIHSIGIRHRDIKPSNILLREDGTVLLADFGISKMGLGKTLSTTTPESPRANTPKYAAPEVGEGGTRGRQADIFSLGAVFLEMLVAHSFPHLRLDLSKKIKSHNSSARAGHHPGQAYAPSLRKVHDWINELQGSLECSEEHWHRMILRLCLKMTSEIREERPPAEEVYSVISGSASLKAEARPNCNCRLASVQTESQKLIKACQKRNGHDEVMSLLKNEKNLETKGAMQQAASHGLLDVVEQFLVRGADVNQLDYCHQTALHCAAAYGHVGIVKLLLDKDARIDIKDEEDQLPIHCASGQGKLKVVEMLLDHDKTGTTVMKKDYYGQIPLHCAAKRGFTDVVRFLIGKMNENDAAVEVDARQRTALHLAAGYGSESVVRLLLDSVLYQDFVNMIDENNMTALHWATIGKQRNGSYIKVMEMLLEKGADLQIRGGAGRKTAIQHARDHQDEERTAILLAAENKGQKKSGARLVADSATDINQMADVLLQEIEHRGQCLDADMKKIKLKLSQFQNSWSQLARVCMILLNIDVRKESLPDYLKKFEDRSLTDYHLPIRTIDLNKVLPPSLSKRFQDEQGKALINVFQFKERDEHYNLTTDEWDINLEYKGDLGKGSSSIIKKVSNKDTGDIYAVKLIPRTEADNERRAADELKMLKRVRHTHIVSFVGSFTSPKLFGLLMVPAAECNLATYLKAACYDSEKRVYLASFCGCLANALNHLHNVSYMTHNDIKPENILIHNGNVFLTDFGISLDWSDTLRTTMFGPASHTTMYSAPEITHEDQLRNSSSDIWSLGCVFLEILSVFMGRKVEDIKQFLKTKNHANPTYKKNSIALQQWIRILESEGPLLGWLGSMLRQNPNSRPNASSLLEMLNDHTILAKSYFGKCCRAEKLSKARFTPQQPEGDDAGVLIEQHSKIAAVNWPGECRVYFQDIDGGIYEAIYFDSEKQWRGVQPKDKIARAKQCSPIAAAAWQESTGHRQPRVHVYFVNEENLLQERIWDPMSYWIEGALGAYKIEIAPSGQLAATSWGDGNIMLCYQSSDNTIRILNEWARERVWRVGTIINAADPDSPLCVTNFEHRGFRAARLYYKTNGLIREACWDKVQDDLRATTDYYIGGYNKPSPPNASISAIAWKSESLEMRVYIGSQNCLNETRYSDSWLHFDLSPQDEERDGHITAVRWATGTGIVRIFHIEARGLAQLTRDNGVWDKEYIMSKTRCACSPPIAQTSITAERTKK